MKMKILRNITSVIFYILSIVPALAEEEEYPDHPPSGNDTPIDSWQLVLMLAAITIGIYFLAKYRKKMEV